MSTDKSRLSVNSVVALLPSLMYLDWGQPYAGHRGPDDIEAVESSSFALKGLIDRHIVCVAVGDLPLVVFAIITVVPRLLIKKPVMPSHRTDPVAGLESLRAERLCRELGLDVAWAGPYRQVDTNELPPTMRSGRWRCSISAIYAFEVVQWVMAGDGCRWLRWLAPCTWPRV